MVPRPLSLLLHSPISRVNAGVAGACGCYLFGGMQPYAPPRSTMSFAVVGVATVHWIVEASRTGEGSLERAVSHALSRAWIAIPIALWVALLTILGAVCFLLPGIYASLHYSLSNEVVALESTNVSGSLERTSEVTGQRLWLLAGTFIPPYIAAELVRSAFTWGLRELWPNLSPLSELLMGLPLTVLDVCSCMETTRLG